MTCESGTNGNKPKQKCLIVFYSRAKCYLKTQVLTHQNCAVKLNHFLLGGPLL